MLLPAVWLVTPLIPRLLMDFFFALAQTARSRATVYRVLKQTRLKTALPGHIVSDYTLIFYKNKLSL